MACYPNNYQHTSSTDISLSVRRLLEGEPFVASFDSTSQYAQGGSSACGLASLNAVRMVLDSEMKGTRNAELIERVSSRQFAEEVSSICSVWASDAHLELDDIYTLPLFDRTLALVHSVYEQSSEAKLKQLLQELRHYGEQASSKSGRPVPIGVVITRPPEIFSVLNLPMPGQPMGDIFVVFDSHSRPSKHPNGSAFLFFPTLDQTAAYLSELLHIDSALLDGEITWQMQLLSHYSGHLFVARRRRVYDTDSIHALYDANMCILELKLSQAEMTTSITEYRARIQALGLENSSLLAQIKRVEKGKAVDTSHRWARNDATSPETPEVGMVRYPSEQPSLLASCTQADVDELHPCEPAPGLRSRLSARTAVSGTLYDNGDSRKASASEVALNSGDQASILLAHRMQAKFSAEDSDLRTQLHDLQSATFQCGICIEDYPMDYVCIVDERDHKFCRGCLKEHITIQLQEHRFPIFCPLCCADNAVEPRSVTRIQAADLGLSQEQAELWTELELAKYSLMLPCRKCEKFAFVDREDHDAMDILYCPFNCGYLWCKACQCQVEHGVKHSCDGTEELKRLMEDKGYKACPGCKTPTEKTHGCNHMTCVAPHCNTHFCYRCGGYIVQSLNRDLIKAALEAHYRACTLFDLPA